MWLDVMRFFSLLFTALALGASMAHLLELPNKMKLSREHYAIAQQLYRGWARLAIVVIGSMLCTLAVVVMTYHHRRAFMLSLTALLCIVATQVIFWIFTFPVNRQTKNWSFIPGNWMELRKRWEYSHAVSAVLNLTALSALVLSLLGTDE